MLPARDTPDLRYGLTSPPRQPLKVAAGKTAAHIEFTRDGRYALASLWEIDGALIYDKTIRSAGTSH